MLQKAYLKKYHPQQYAHSTDAPNKRFGGKVSALFRRRRDDSRELEPATPTESEEGIADITHGFQLFGLLNYPSELVSDDNAYRGAAGQLNTLRLMRAENLGDGYDVSDILYMILIGATPNDSNAVSSRTRIRANYQGCSYQIYGWNDVSAIKLRSLLESDTACSTACAKHDNLAMSTKAEVENALVGTDTSDLRASFRRALSFSIPPPTLYRNYRPGAYSELVFGVSLVDVETNQDNVPKVMRMCIEEVEKRGLNTNKIYSVS
jgi:hypothetical protein